MRNIDINPIYNRDLVLRQEITKARQTLSRSKASFVAEVGGQDSRRSPIYIVGDRVGKPKTSKRNSVFRDTDPNTLF